MLKTTQKFLLIAVLLMVILACGAPGGAPAAPILDPNAVNTAIAGTSAAAATQTGLPGIPAAGQLSTPTRTKIATATPFPTYTIVAFKEMVPLVTVTKNTNCRSGPGELYPKVGALRAGETAEVLGRSRDAKYWIIRNPNNPKKSCWLSGIYATVTGAAGALHVFTPPPVPTNTKPPTPEPLPTRTSAPPVPPPTAGPSATSTPDASYAASYSNLDLCNIDWWAEIQLQNTGVITFQSMAMAVRDINVNGNVLATYSEDFINQDGCGVVNTTADVPPGTTQIVSLPSFTYDPTGHELEAIISLCSGPGQTGTCTTKQFTFTP